MRIPTEEPPIFPLALAWAALIPLLVSGCGPGEAPAWRGVVDTVDGTPVVRNPAEPLYPPGAVALEPVWNQSGPETGAIWEQVQDVAAGTTGVFVLDRMAVRVHRLNATTGALEATFGREGEGPGELQSPVGIELLDGSPLVLDGGSGALVSFDMEGEPLATIRPNAILFGIYILGGDSILATTFGAEGRLSMVSDTGLRPVPEPGPKAGVEDHFESCRRSAVVDTLVVNLSCVIPYFQLFDTHGRPVREVVVDRHPVERTDAEIETYLSGLREDLAESGQPAQLIDQFTAQQREAQRLRRPWRSLRRDPASGFLALLEQEADDFGGGPATLHLFNEDGVYLAALEQTASWSDFEFIDGDIVAVVRAPDTGLASVVRYRLTGLDR